MMMQRFLSHVVRHDLRVLLERRFDLRGVRKYNHTLDGSGGHGYRA